MFQRLQRRFFISLLVFFCGGLSSQNLEISGNVQDTSLKSPLPKALVVALRFSDELEIETISNFNNNSDDIPKWRNMLFELFHVW